ncbi:MAG: response regulator transcription factor [Gammaproteobacteria bacterium]|nr:response regulator transcription factor [Gammaproteobacteria bacterium]MCP5299826.1 response regulator transcription factor [Chromatiaceae bacterium]
MQGTSVLVVEDEHDTAQLLSRHLASFCDEVAVADNGHEGLRLAAERRWGLIILDIGLPGLNGLEVCRRIRAGECHTPVLMLSARNSDFDRVLGLDIGADDYVAKPFCLQELLARVRAIFRRIALPHRIPDGGSQRRLHHGGLAIDVARRTASVDGSDVDLTAREFALLLHLVRHPGRVFSRAQLLDQVWGHGYSGMEHTVNSHINRLRAKIETDPSSPRRIVTVWGVGYRLD